MRFKDFLQEETSRQYLDRLINTLKISRLGSGMYAHVFQHPVYHNVAVKFVRNDPDYIKYIEICMKHSDNRWFPKIVSLHKLVMDLPPHVPRVRITPGNFRERDKLNKEQDAYLVFFQKLRSATKTEIRKAVQDILSDVPDEFFDKSEVLTKRSDVSDFMDFLPNDWVRLAKLTKRKDVKQLAETLASLRAEDIHNNNVMMRDEGDRSQLVFTDPVAT